MLHAGESSNFVQSQLVVSHSLRQLGVLFASRNDAERQQTLWLESQRDSLKSQEAAEKKPAADQYDNTQRGFRYDQQVAYPQGRTGWGFAGSLF